MIPLPIKLQSALAELDQRKHDLLKGWLMSMDDLGPGWNLAPDYSALIKKEDANVPTDTESS